MQTYVESSTLPKKNHTTVYMFFIECDRIVTYDPCQST